MTLRKIVHNRTNPIDVAWPLIKTSEACQARLTTLHIPAQRNGESIGIDNIANACITVRPVAGIMGNVACRTFLNTCLFCSKYNKNRILSKSTTQYFLYFIIH